MVVLDVTMDITPRVEAIIIYVDDDYGSEDATHKMTIQAAVDAANPGDTVFVYNGTYHENVAVDKTINLIGEDKDNTIIDKEGNEFVVKIYANWTNITGFTITGGGIFEGGGIGLDHVHNCKIIDNIISWNKCYGISNYYSNSNYLMGNLLSNNPIGYYIWGSNGNNITNNIVSFNDGAIFLMHSSKNNITGNNVSNSITGISLGSPGSCSYNILSNNNVSNNDWGIYLSNSVGNNITDNIVTKNGQGIHLGMSSHNNSIENNEISNNDYGVHSSGSSINNFVLNSSITSATNYHFFLKESSIVISINTTFNKTKTYFENTECVLITQWYLHINVTDTLGNQIPSVTVSIEDNQDSLPAQRYTTDSEGYIRWLTQTEYIEQDTNGDKKGEKTYHTPHRITAWNETLMGYAEVNINESKEVNIVLDTPSFEIPLSVGWNQISLPLVQSDTSISTVLSSIAGNWDVVWWYNASIGKWHSTNDNLTDINHTMGFWIHMKTSDTLIVTGTIPNTTSIQLYQGWNLVGNPSFYIHVIDDILSPITTKYTAVQQYDSWDSEDPWKHYHINKPSNLNDLACMTCGRGYWLYVKEDCVWEVSNF
jgi:parallel beta-helix repeat protein